MRDIGTDTLFFAGIPEYLRIAAPVVKRAAGGSFRLPSVSDGGIDYIGHGYLDRPNATSDVAVEPLSAASSSRVSGTSASGPSNPTARRGLDAGATQADPGGSH